MGKVNDLENAKKQLLVVRKLLEDIGSPLKNSPIIEEGKSSLVSRISEFLERELVTQDVPEKSKKVIIKNFTEFLKRLMKGVF